MSFLVGAKKNKPIAMKYLRGKKDIAQITADLRTLKPAMQATALMAFAMSAEEIMGFASWYEGPGALAHGITMSLQERYNIYGEKMFEPSDKQMDAVLRAALQARDML